MAEIDVLNDSVSDSQIIVADTGISMTFPFKINESQIDFSVDVIHAEYLQNCFPDHFNDPSTVKSKKLRYKVIDENFYEPSARMVAFRIHRSRLEAWIRALGVLNYDHYGKLLDIYDIDWHDEPMQWEEDTPNRSIVIDLIKIPKRLYKLTLFITK